MYLSKKNGGGERMKMNSNRIFIKENPAIYLKFGKLYYKIQRGL